MLKTLTSLEITVLEKAFCNSLLFVLWEIFFSMWMDEKFTHSGFEIKKKVFSGGGFISTKTGFGVIIWTKMEL